MRTATNLRILLPLFLAIASCEPPATDPPLPKQATKQPVKGESKRVEIAKNVVLEIGSNGTRRVRIPAEVCLREGLLELFMCRRGTKEHEAIITANVDARDVHAALLAAGAKPGSTVRYVPKYQPASGSKIRVLVEYTHNGKLKTINAREWVRDGKTKKDLKYDWVFGGSVFYPDQTDDAKAPKKPKLYAANGGDLICVSNFESAMLDLPVESPSDNEELQFEPHTERIPPLGEKVTVILEPMPDPKPDGGKPPAQKK